MEDKLVTLAIHVYQKAQILKTILESEGITVYLHNVNLIQPVVSSGVRVRIKESDLPAALKIIESTTIFKEEIASELGEPSKKIVLIPVDFSRYSTQACEIGFNYAHQIDAEVVILHAYFTPFLPTTISLSDSFAYQTHNEDTIASLTEKAKINMAAFSDFINVQIKEKKWPEISYSCVLRDGLPEEEIAAYSEEFKPALIVMGTRGRNQKDLDLIGSVTAEVIEMSKHPVFAIPENTPFHNLLEVKRIAFGTSFEQKDLIAFDSLYRIFEKFDVEYYLFHIANRPDTWNEIKLGGIKNYFEKQYPSITIKYELIDANDFAFNLEHFIRSNTIDIVSLATHRRNIFTRIFNPSIAQKMLFHSDTPMLALKN